MAWKFEIGGSAEADLLALGFQGAREVLGYLNRQIAPTEDPRRVGRPCRTWRTGTAPDGDPWRYETGGVAIAVEIDDDAGTITVLSVLRTE
jgi:mRNA-degrading endonuclease RelE of RelBE toxin-antitoxin system